MVLDTSLEAVLVRSKRAVLQTILYSDDMQAAFRAYEVGCTVGASGLRPSVSSGGAYE